MGAGGAMFGPGGPVISVMGPGGHVFVMQGPTMGDGDSGPFIGG